MEHIYFKTNSSVLDSFLFNYSIFFSVPVPLLLFPFRWPLGGAQHCLWSPRSGWCGVLGGTVGKTGCGCPRREDMSQFGLRFDALQGIRNCSPFREPFERFADELVV